MKLGTVLQDGAARVAVAADEERAVLLDPGDIIAMGTAFKPSASAGPAIQNVNLVALGGPIEVTISGIGTLSNPVELQ